MFLVSIDVVCTKIPISDSAWEKGGRFLEAVAATRYPCYDCSGREILLLLLFFFVDIILCILA